MLGNEPQYKDSHLGGAQIGGQLGHGANTPKRVPPLEVAIDQLYKTVEGLAGDAIELWKAKRPIQQGACSIRLQLVEYSQIRCRHSRSPALVILHGSARHAEQFCCLNLSKVCSRTRRHDLLWRYR